MVVKSPAWSGARAVSVKSQCPSASCLEARNAAATAVASSGGPPSAAYPVSQYPACTAKFPNASARRAAAGSVSARR